MHSQSEDSSRKSGIGHRVHSVLDSNLEKFVMKLVCACG